jgi:hypothetical protein
MIASTTRTVDDDRVGRPDFIGAHGLGANSDASRTPGDAHIIVFNKTGASAGDVAALSRILNNEHLKIFDSRFSAAEPNERIAAQGI